jgi:RNA polymerase sigma-70 factor (ECF subfamily)
MNPLQPESPDLELIFRECGKDLKAYFARRHPGNDAAADLVQESFLQLAKRFQTGAPPRSARAYLFGIARHVSLSFFRAQKKEPQPVGEVSEEGSHGDTEDRRASVAQEVIAGLPELQREILDLRFTHGLSYAETATALGIPIGTVRSRLHHAINLLRRRLEELERSETERDRP